MVVFKTPTELSDFIVLLLEKLDILRFVIVLVYFVDDIRKKLTHFTVSKYNRRCLSFL